MLRHLRASGYAGGRWYRIIKNGCVAGSASAVPHQYVPEGVGCSDSVTKDCTSLPVRYSSAGTLRRFSARESVRVWQGLRWQRDGVKCVLSSYLHSSGTCLQWHCGYCPTGFLGRVC